MSKTAKATGWIVAAASAVGACVVVALVGSAPTNSVATTKVSRPMTHDTSVADGSAREAAAAECTRRVEAWRSYLRLLRSPERLGSFVDELIGIQQKFHLAMEAFQGTRYPQRVLDLFRQRVVDDRQLAADLDATIAAYDQFLFEQDRRVYEPAGVSREEWMQMVHGGCQWSINWSGYLTPVVQRAISEARTDAVRFAGTQMAADFAGNQIKNSARAAGLDESDQGSFGDWVIGFIADVGAGVAFDQLTDAREDIVSRLSAEMARAEHALLDDEWGLGWVLRRTEAAHEQARSELISTTAKQKE